MRYYKSQKQLRVNVALWAWSTTDGGIRVTVAALYLAGRSGKYGLPPAQSKGGDISYQGKWPGYRGSLSFSYYNCSSNAQGKKKWSSNTFLLCQHYSCICYSFKNCLVLEMVGCGRTVCLCLCRSPWTVLGLNILHCPSDSLLCLYMTGQFFIWIDTFLSYTVSSVRVPRRLFSWKRSRVTQNSRTLLVQLNPITSFIAHVKQSLLVYDSPTHKIVYSFTCL